MTNVIFKEEKAKWRQDWQDRVCNMSKAATYIDRLNQARRLFRNATYDTRALVQLALEEHGFKKKLNGLWRGPDHCAAFADNMRIPEAFLLMQAEYNNAFAFRAALQKLYLRKRKQVTKRAALLRRLG